MALWNTGPPPSWCAGFSNKVTITSPTIHLLIYWPVMWQEDFPDGSVGKELAHNARDTGDAGSILRLKRSSGEGSGNPLQYSCLENPKDIGAWWAIVQRVANSQTQLCD